MVSQTGERRAALLQPKARHNAEKKDGHDSRLEFARVRIPVRLFLTLHPEIGQSPVFLNLTEVCLDLPPRLAPLMHLGRRPSSREASLTRT